jgi:hypothetical protein
MPSKLRAARFEVAQWRDAHQAGGRRRQQRSRTGA